MTAATARSFLDANVLVYSDDDGSPEKKRRALDLLDQQRTARTGVVSTQILQEYFAATTRRLRVDAATARAKIEKFGRFDVVQIDVTDILAAIDLHRLHQFSFWDALVVRAALQGGCSVLYSEDFQDGQRVNGLQVVNPFKGLAERSRRR